VAVHIVAGAACASSLLIFLPAPPPDAEAAPQKAQRGTMFQKLPPADSGMPARLHIPRIGVDTVIESVGLTAKGAVGVPLNPDNAGWYSPGVRPGENGNAVIDGHLNWYGGKAAVFQNLHTLRKGDLLSVETDKGRFLLFVVRETRTYAPYEYAPELFAKSDTSHLNLVTCDGVWDPVRKIYSKRIVVFADAVETM